MKTTFCNQFKILASIVEVLLINSTILVILFFSFFLSSDHECLDHNPPHQTAHIIK